MELFQQGMFVHDPRHDTPETIAQKRAIIAKIMSSQNAPRTIGDGLNALGDGIVANVLGRRADEAAAAGQESASEAFNPLLDAFRSRTGLDANGFPAAPNPGDSTSMAAMPAPDYASARVAQAHGDSGGGFNGDLRSGIIATAEAIGADPLDLATAISYETAGTFDPTKRGPRTQWGQHRGLIQFGEPQARQHGVDWNDPLGSQLGPNGAIASYFRSSGFKPGMSGLDLYSTINAGAPGRYRASDANNGGAPGSVQDKWENQMAGHRRKAAALLGSAGLPAAPAAPASASSLTPEALQSWAFANYAPQSQGEAVDAVNGLATGTLPDPAQWPDIQRRAMASAPADPATWPQRQAELLRETSPQWLNDMIDGNGVPVAETEADILAQEQAMMAQDPQAFQQPGAGAPQAAAGQYAPLMPHQPAPPLPDPRMVQDMPVAPMQVAQAGGFPEMAGRNPQAIPAPGIDMQMIANVLTNPFSNPEQRAFAQMLLEQQMQSRDPMRQLDMDYKRAQIEKMQREAAGGGNEIFGTPIYGRDPNTGQMVLGAMGKDGSFKRLDTGGVDVTPGVTWQDFGTHRQAFDRSGNPVGGPVLRQGDVPGAHRQGPDGSLSPMPGSPLDNERRAELAKVEDNAYSIISMIDSLYSDPYLDGMLGPARSRLPNISADAARVQSKMDQIGGQAFLQAFQTLRGGGQISNVEGEKAQAAIARLNTAQSPKDYRQALNELKGIVQTSLERARGSAGSGAGGNPPSGASSDGWQDMGGVRIRRKQ